MLGRADKQITMQHIKALSGWINNEGMNFEQEGFIQPKVTKHWTSKQKILKYLTRSLEVMILGLVGKLSFHSGTLTAIVGMSPPILKIDALWS